MLNLIIFGPPGVGKGTQAILLAKEFSLSHLSSGDLLRQELDNSQLGKQIKRYQDAGKLVPNSLVIKMIEKAVSAKIKGAGFIFDGYPRNLRQAQALDRFLKKHQAGVTLVLNLQLSQTTALQRILERSKKMKIKRSDDNTKTAKNRFRVYRAQTVPLIKYYQTQKKIINIDGRPAIKMIFRNISGKIKMLKK